MADIQLGYIHDIQFFFLTEPVGKLPDVPHIGGNSIGRRLFYLGQVVFVSADQIQHTRKPFPF